mgnify:CR=1 FL=1
MNLWAPWRMGYILGPREEGCIFCDKPKENQDERNLILLRGRHCFALLNLYPYSNGHLMIAPYRHVGRLPDLTQDECLEMMSFAQRAVAALSQAVNAEAFNLGINQGGAAGAGIEEHLHLHVVPRWEGDTNFMPVLGAAKVIPQALEETYRLLRQALQASPP